ncbi:MAG: hypothetical protein AAGI37_18210 [Planctomycetota bacterium]
MAAGNPYKAQPVSGGTIVTPLGQDTRVFKVTGGQARRRLITKSNITGPSDGGSTTFCEGNYVYVARLRGVYVEGIADLSGVSYTHSSITLSLTGGFPTAVYEPGMFIYVSGGTNATAGWYEIATNPDNDTVTLTTAPGTGDQSDFAVNSANKLDGYSRGLLQISMGNGEQWAGTAILDDVGVSFDYTGGASLPTVLDCTYSGPVTVTPRVG